MSTRFHIKSNGDLGPCKARRPGNCPYGGDSGTENHFDSIEEATKAFEEKWADELVPKAVKKAPSKKTPVAKSKAYLSIEKSQVIKDPEVSDSSGYLGGSRFVGGKVAEGRAQYGGYIHPKYVTSEMRKDIKEAVALGELPEDLSYSVRKNTGAGVSSITISVGKKDGRSTNIIPAEYYSREQSQEYRNTGGETKDGKKLRAYLEALGNQWCEYDINSQVDYFHSSHRARVTWVV